MVKSGGGIRQGLNSIDENSSISEEEDSQNDESNVNDSNNNIDSQQNVRTIPTYECLFCGTQSENVQANLRHMITQHGFFVPC